MRTRWMALVLMLLIAACGSNEGDGNSSNELATLGEEITEAHCAKIFTCCSESERQAAFGGIPVEDLEQCNSSVQGIVQINVIPSYRTAVDEGTVNYDSSGLDNCIESFNRLACDEFEPDPRFAIADVPGCRALFEATLETTEFCTEDFECKSGFCALEAGDDQGTCAEEPGEDESCIAGRCAFGLYCADGTCTPQQPDDSPCDADSQCSSDNCVDVALEGEPTDFRCRPLPAACGG